MDLQLGSLPEQYVTFSNCCLLSGTLSREKEKVKIVPLAKDDKASFTYCSCKPINILTVLSTILYVVPGNKACS